MGWGLYSQTHLHGARLLVLFSFPCCNIKENDSSYIHLDPEWSIKHHKKHEEIKTVFCKCPCLLIIISYYKVL